MSDTAPNSTSRGPMIILGALAMIASFPLLQLVLQTFAGGKPSDSQGEVRLKNKAEIVEAQSALLKKSGLADHADAVIAKSVEQLGTRKLETSKVVVPGSPTAIKQSAAAPAPAAPAKPAAAPAPGSPPAVPAPAPSAPPAAPTTQPPAPVAPAPATPAPAPVPVTPPPAPPVPGTK